MWPFPARPVRRPLAARSSVALTVAVSCLVGPFAAPATAGAVPEPGADGIGDPYFPLDGNGGIDVLRYEIRDDYRFGDGRLRGRTRLTVRATQDLSRFNLDLLLPVREVTVDGVAAAHEKPHPHELAVTPAAPVAAGETFHVTVRYSGHPGRIAYPETGSGTGSPTTARSWR